MRKNILGFVFIGLALISAGLGIKAWLQQPEEISAIKNAIYLEQPVALPDNEGKLIIANGQITTTKNAIDKKYGLELHTPYAQRSGQAKNKAKEDNWDSEPSLSTTYVGAARLGQLELSEDILSGIPKESNYKDFIPAELTRRRLSAPDYIGNEYWVYDNHYRGSKAYHYARFRYNYVPQNAEITVIGTQQGHTIVSGDGPCFIKPGKLSKNDILKETEDFLPAAIGASAVTLIFLILGLKKLKVF